MVRLRRRARPSHLTMQGSSPWIPSVAMPCASDLQTGTIRDCSPGRFFTVSLTVQRREPRAKTRARNANSVQDPEQRAVRLAHEMRPIS